MIKPAPKAATQPVEWLALAGGLVLLLWFQLDTWPVRFANVDDVESFRFSQNGLLLDYIDGLARSQSRFYQLWNLGLIDLFHHIGPPFWYALHRTVLLGLEYALGGWLLARLCGAARYGWLFWIVGLGTLQLPPGYYPVLSYASIAFGFVALLTAALAYDHALTAGKRSLLVWAAVCFFASLLFHETFAIYALVFPLILRARRPKAFRASLPTLWPLGLAFAGYFAIYLSYRWINISEHSYDGTTPSFTLWPALQAWIRYSFSVAPGFELWVLRNDQLGAPLFQDAHTVAQHIRQGLTFAVVAKTAIVAVCTALLLHKPHRALTGRLTLRLAAAAACPALLACVPIALSIKYQEWAHLRQIPYAYSFFTCFFAWGALSALFISGAGSRPGMRHGLVHVLAVVVVAYAAFCAQISNPRVLAQLAAKYNRPVGGIILPVDPSP